MQGTTSGRTQINECIKNRREPFNLERLQKNNPDIIEEDFWALCEEFWDFTCLTPPAMYNLYSACAYVVEKNVPGDFIECGVFFGGSVMLAAKTLDLRDGLRDRRVCGIDTFTGFVSRSEHDVTWNGNDACIPRENAFDFYNQANGNIRSVDCDQSRIDVVRGDVFEVLEPTLQDRQIAVLRLDTDSYDTTKHELEVAWDRVSSGGIVIIDDYGWCLGARKATDDFLKGRKAYLNRVNPWTRSIVKL